nr:type I restriction-modification enzyme R subunit C-terminal domain-containing protein [Methylicorpusculum oleiharenae]
MDFKGATRLFADPDFDGDPVVIYEPKPDEPVVPPDPPSTLTEPTPPTYVPGEEEPGVGGGTGGEGRIKYVLGDIEVQVAVERSQYLDADGKLITEDYRVLLKEDIKKSLQAQFGSLTNFLRRWSEAERKQAILEELKDLGIPLEVLQQAVSNGEELDAFDLVAHVAFNQKPLTRRERANQVKKRDVFSKYGDQARAVLNALLDKFADHGIQDIEDSKVLELPPFDQIGTKTQIRRGIFGSAENFALAVHELENALYQEATQQKSA